MGFHRGIGKIAHGILRIHRLHVAELCGSPRVICRFTDTVHLIGVGVMAHVMLSSKVVFTGFPIFPTCAG